jgi:assimilatory nitrate reductase catalytic subunit
VKDATRTTCAYCGVGCGIAVDAAGALTGDRSHPANFGRLCSKGAALGETLGPEERLGAPSIDGRRASWDEALDLIAQRFLETIRTYGPDSVAFYVSGQFLTEDYYVANKLMKGFIGSANIDTNSRLCMASSVAGHVRAFGEDVVPGCYDDLEETDLAVLVGSNMAWCHPVLYQRLIAARERRKTKLVVIDPRRTPTCDGADLHLPIRAGSDVLLFNGLLAYLAEHEAVDRQWVERHVAGYAETLSAARESFSDIGDLAGKLGIERHALLQFYEFFARTERAMTLYSQGVNQSESGTDKVNAIINCHLATAKIGRPGMGPFSLTGQPNAMGGREVGGLANQLAAHMNFSPENVDRVRRFWSAPAIAARPGLKAVELFDAVHDGRIRAIWIAATNPAASMPDAGRVRAALDNCPFVVVSDCWPTDTTDRANVILPAAAWAEKVGTVTNSERRISRQRAFRAPYGEARPDWWMFAEIGRRMGWAQAFAFQDSASVFREHASLSAFENDGRRLFDLGALSAIDDADYEALGPVQWPYPRRDGPRARLFANGVFPTPDGRGRMIPTPVGEPQSLCGSGALRLNTGRVRDQWHTMTRTGRVPRLMLHSDEPVLDLHPTDAARAAITDGGLGIVTTAHGRSILRVRVNEAQREGEIFAPMHWSDRYASSGPVARLVTPRTDPVSGQPDLKGTAAKVEPLAELWRGILFHRREITPLRSDNLYWTKAPLDSGTFAKLSGSAPLSDMIASEAMLRRILDISPAAELISYGDARKAVFRYAGIENGKLEACLFLAPATAKLPDASGVAPLLGSTLSEAQRLALLSGTGTDRACTLDRAVCACFAVGESVLLDAIRSGRVRSIDEIGAAFRAGTNCGSCIPELRTLLGKTRLLAAEVIG